MVKGRFAMMTVDCVPLMPCSSSCTALAEFARISAAGASIASNVTPSNVPASVPVVGGGVVPPVIAAYQVNDGAPVSLVSVEAPT